MPRKFDWSPHEKDSLHAVARARHENAAQALESFYARSPSPVRTKGALTRKARDIVQRGDITSRQSADLTHFYQLLESAKITTPAAVVVAAVQGEMAKPRRKTDVNAVLHYQHRRRAEKQQEDFQALCDELNWSPPKVDD
jgi:hypothetical protein